LACISNDASFELNPSLSTSINIDAFEPMVVKAKHLKIKRFIYASSSSVYGVSNEPEVTESHPLVPLTLYNKYKGMCEPLLFKHIDEDFTGVVFRPATVCGYSTRQRLDLSVNILTNLAVNKKEITVFGGNQRRPNIHIEDYAEVVNLLVSAPKSKIQGQIFNVGNENLTINKISQLVKKNVELEFPSHKNINIIHSESSDNRSYHINSDKIFYTLGFRATKTVENAIIDLCHAFRGALLKNSLTDSRYFNVKYLKENKII
jgi:nucleoside-diphosphate-sugar epimerase